MTILFWFVVRWLSGKWFRMPSKKSSSRTSVGRQGIRGYWLGMCSTKNVSESDYIPPVILHFGLVSFHDIERVFASPSATCVWVVNLCNGYWISKLKLNGLLIMKMFWNEQLLISDSSVFIVIRHVIWCGWLVLISSFKIQIFGFYLEYFLSFSEFWLFKIVSIRIVKILYFVFL